jgi:hypothetical protein
MGQNDHLFVGQVDHVKFKSLTCLSKWGMVGFILIVLVGQAS